MATKVKDWSVPQGLKEGRGELRLVHSLTHQRMDLAVYMASGGKGDYINYSQICARIVRQCLKDVHKASVAGRDECIMKTAKWENGKIVQTVEAPTKISQ